jgi:hypothetical protein
MSKSKTPYIKTRSPLKILRAVAKAILEEPKRYDQDEWRCLLKNEELQPTPYWTKRDISRALKSYPSCGTKACVAGWAVTLTHKRPTLVNLLGIPGRAQKLLRLNSEEANRLFDGEPLEVASVQERGHLPGSKAYARAGVRHIAAFVKEKWGVKLGVGGH